MPSGIADEHALQALGGESFCDDKADLVHRIRHNSVNLDSSFIAPLKKSTPRSKIIACINEYTQRLEPPKTQKAPKSRRFPEKCFFTLLSTMGYVKIKSLECRAEYSYFVIKCQDSPDFLTTMSPPNQKDHLLVILAAFFYGLITVSGKYFADSRLFSLRNLFTYFFYAGSLDSILVFKQEFRIGAEQFRFFIVFGLIGALLQLSQFAGIVLGVPVAIVALLLYTQPVWTTALGKWLLGERITRAKILSATLALLGILFLVNPAFLDLRLDSLGIFAALLAGLFLSLWVIWGRKSAIRNQHFVTTTFGYSFFSSCWLLVLYVAASPFTKGVSFARLDFGIYMDAWPAVLGFTIFASLTPACLAFAGMKKVDASTAGVLLLLEPVSAALFAYLLFGQPLTSNIWLGGILILTANFVLLRSASTPGIAVHAPPSNNPAIQ